MSIPTEEHTWAWASSPKEEELLKSASTSLWLESSTWGLVYRSYDEEWQQHWYSSSDERGFWFRYTIKAAVLFTVRFFLYNRKKWGFYLIEFCESPSFWFLHQSVVLSKWLKLWTITTDPLHLQFLSSKSQQFVPGFGLESMWKA